MVNLEAAWRRRVLPWAVPVLVLLAWEIATQSGFAAIEERILQRVLREPARPEAPHHQDGQAWVNPLPLELFRFAI